MKKNDAYLCERDNFTRLLVLTYNLSIQGAETGTSL